MTDADDMPVPGLEQVFGFDLTFGSRIDLGRLATGGVRVVLPITGGGIRGPRLGGVVISGGETMLTRADGVTSVEAQYLLRTDGGSPVRVLGTGYCGADAGFDGTRMTLAFEVDQTSDDAWLATRVFVGERRNGETTLLVTQIL